MAGGRSVLIPGASRREQRFDADGRTFYVVQFSPGLVVPSGGSVCVNNSDGATETGAMSGYFAKDKEPD